MITLNRLAKRCFDIALKRKKMTETTSPKAVVLAISSEWRELAEAGKDRSNHIPSWSEREEEAADVIIATLTYLEKIGCNDIEQLLKDKVEFNSYRVD